MEYEPILRNSGKSHEIEDLDFTDDELDVHGLGKMDETLQSLHRALSENESNLDERKQFDEAVKVLRNIEEDVRGFFKGIFRQF